MVHHHNHASKSPLPPKRGMSHQTTGASKAIVHHVKKTTAPHSSAHNLVFMALMPATSLLLFVSFLSIVYTQWSSSRHAGHILLDSIGFPTQSQPVSLVRKILVAQVPSEIAPNDLNASISLPRFTFPAGRTPDLWKSEPFVMTTFFTSRADPQRGSNPRERRGFSYISQWHQSLQRLGLHGVVFTDSADLHELQKLSTDKIIFVKVRIDAYRSQSLNDVRFFVYRDFLRSLKRKPAMVFMTDGSDVAIVQNPFPSFVKDNTLYLGGIRPNKLWKNDWMLGQFRRMQRGYERNSTGFFKYDDILQHDTVNAGVIGGETSVVLELLDRMTELFDMFDPAPDINMGVLNVVAWRHFQGRMVYGDPVVSKFKKYEYWRRNIYFRHKR
eukprot:2482044-Rhodomonas_salina.1